MAIETGPRAAAFINAVGLLEATSTYPEVLIIP